MTTNRRRVLGALFCVLAGATASAEPPHAGKEVLFTDVTLAAGIDFTETIGDDKMSNIVESAGVGCGFLDFDGDGWMDVYFVSGCWQKGLSDPKLDAARRDRLAAATDRLYRNRGDGTFVDVTAKAGLIAQSYGMAVVAADYDGDGDTDLYITNYGPNALYRNNGDGTFTNVAKTAGVDDPHFSVGAVFLDYDRDGRLDLYVGNYVTYDPDYKYYYAPDAFPGPLAYTGQQDRLYRGNPDATFTDVSAKAGIKVKPIGRAMGIGAFDYDADGFQDIFVSNDAMENFLLRNQRNGTFENRATEAGVAFGEGGDTTAAMAAEIGDYNDDGRADLFVPDMRFCCLYKNEGGGFFEDVSALSGVAATCGQYVSWGSAFADYDLDGDLDLYISNGAVHHLEAQEDLLFLGDGRGRFTDVSESSGAWANKKFVSRGVASGDFDNDGDVDLLVTSLNARPVLLRNDTPRRDRHWLGVHLIGLPGNRDALGAVVKVKAGGRTMMRIRTSAGSYLSQHDARLHFGLGGHADIAEVEITWPDGSRQVLKNVRADRLLTVRQEPRPT